MFEQLILKGAVEPSGMDSETGEMLFLEELYIL
jgi:hypothetical protein